MKRILPTLVSTLITAGALPLAHAHPEPFGYVRGAQSEAKGEWEVEQWTTARIGKQSGDYLGLDINTELEYGVTDRFQVALYLNNQHLNLRNAQGNTKVFDDRDGFDFNGVSGEMKYQLSDPYRNPWGFSLYFEPGFGRHSSNSGEREDSVFLEFKGIVERHFFDHRLIAAFNYTLEPEWEREPGGDWETALEMEWAFGLSWQLAPHWRVGAEALLRTEFEEADLGKSEFSTFSLGPTVQYSREDWYVSLTALPQLTGWPDSRGSSGRQFDEAEQLEVRLKFGVEF